MPTFHEFCYTDVGHTFFFNLVNSSGIGQSGETSNLTAKLKVVGGETLSSKTGIDEVSDGLYYLAVSSEDIGPLDGTAVLLIEHTSHEDIWTFIHVIEEMPADAKVVSDKAGYALSDASWETMFNKSFMGKEFWRILVGWSSFFFGRILGGGSSTPILTDLSGNQLIKMQQVAADGSRGAISVDYIDEDDYFGS